MFSLSADMFPTGFDNHHRGVLKYSRRECRFSPNHEDIGGAQRNPNIGTSCKFYAPAAFPPAKDPPAPINKRVSGLQRRSGHFGEQKNLYHCRESNS